MSLGKVKVSNYEVKINLSNKSDRLDGTRFFSQVSGLEHEIEAQKEDYEKKLTELSSRLESIETGMKSAEEREEEKSNSEKAQLEELDKLKEEMAAKFADVSTKVFTFCQFGSSFFLQLVLTHFCQ